MPSIASFLRFLSSPCVEVNRRSSSSVLPVLLCDLVAQFSYVVAFSCLAICFSVEAAAVYVKKRF